MKHKREKMKAALMAEEVIDELLNWHEGAEAPTLTQIEDIVLKLRKRMGERMVESVVEDQEAVRPVPGPSCPSCGREMHYKGMKEVRVTGQVGETDLLRAYYYCDRCRRGLFPPGSATEAKSETLE
jgi:hypothetical protein